MIYWCSYCQKFLGERPPLENKSFSHGMCKSCAAVGLSLSDDQFNRMDYLVSLNRRFWSAGEAENHDEIVKLAEEGMSQGIRPIDILFGFAGPLLYKVGVLWERNEITYLDEQRFTRSCETLVAIIAKRISVSRDPSAPTSSKPVLLSNVEGNIHTLGVHFASIGLASLGISSEIVMPPLKPEAFVDLVMRENFKVIGVSVALASQCVDLYNILAAFKNEPTFSGKIIVGGAAISQKVFYPPAALNVHFLSSPCFDDTERDFWVFNN